MTSLLDSKSATMYGSLPATTTKNTATTNWLDPRHLFGWARLAGCLYVVIIVCGMTSEVGLRGSILVANDDKQTFANLLATPARLRASVLSDACMSVADVLVSVVLASVLLQAGSNLLWTTLATVFRLVQQAVLMANLIHLVAACLLVDESLAVYAALQSLLPSNDADGNTVQPVLTLLFFHLHTYGYALAMIFFALALVSLGIVLWTSRIYPRWLAVSLLLAGTGYMIDSVAYFCVADYSGDTGLSQVCMLPVLVGEVGLAVTLLVQPPQMVAVVPHQINPIEDDST